MAGCLATRGNLRDVVRGGSVGSGRVVVSWFRVGAGGKAESSALSKGLVWAGACLSAFGGKVVE